MNKYLLLVFSTIQLSLFAQSPTLQVVRQNLTNYSNNYQQEKIYIHFDKPAYAAGETVWFKAYIMKGADASDLSKTLYVDFSDASGKLLFHGTYPVWQAAAAGSFPLELGYAGKSLHVNAYTKWMKNYDSSFLYNADLRIALKLTPEDRAAAKVRPQAGIKFLPEGGDCITGIKTKVAFKAVYANGVPANVTGVVTDSRGVTVDTIQSMHDGMGYFYLEPQPNEIYTAKWTDDYKKAYTTQLPVAKSEGAALEIKPAKDVTGFIIKTPASSADKYKQMHIVATMQQQVIYMATINLDVSNTTGGSMLTKQMPSGILQVTLFNAAWQPLAERICFINNNNYRFKADVSFSEKSMAKRAKNILVVDVPDSIESNLSVSVTDERLGIDSTSDIISHLLLTGDLKGEVYHPSYYFSDTSEAVGVNLDLVMLTNGWRRFGWNELIAGNMPKLIYSADTAYLNLGGYIKNANARQLKRENSLFVMIAGRDKDTQRHFFTMPVNADGSFTQPGMTFYDTLDVFYQFLSKKGRGYNNYANINFTSGELPAPAYGYTPRTYTNYISIADYENAVKLLLAEQARLAELLKQTNLKPVTVTGYTKTKLELIDDKYARGMFSGGDPAVQVDVVNDITATGSGIMDYVMRKAPSLRMVSDPKKGIILTFFGAETDFYINEIRTSASDVSHMSVSDVAYIKVMRPPFYGSAFGGIGGAVLIYTRRGDEVPDFVSRDRQEHQIVVGYTAPKEFYSPDYSDPKQNTALEDVRSTLYWNPWVITTRQNHTITLPFYNNDITTKMRVVLEGVNRDGKLTRIEKVIE